MSPDSGELHLILSPEQIQERVAELGRQISGDYHGKDLLLIGILKGAFIFLSDLARHMDLPVQVDFVRLASYGDSCTSSGNIEMTKCVELPLKGRSVLVVEDIVDTGLTLQWFLNYLRDQGAAEVKTCALIDKPERRDSELAIDYVGFKIPQGFLVGYGLDYNEHYRYLPGVYELIL